jgi:hypothetical protein
MLAIMGNAVDIVNSPRNLDVYTAIKNNAYRDDPYGSLDVTLYVASTATGRVGRYGILVLTLRKVSV